VCVCVCVCVFLCAAVWLCVVWRSSTIGVSRCDRALVYVCDGDQKAGMQLSLSRDGIVESVMDLAGGTGTVIALDAAGSGRTAYVLRLGVCFVVECMSCC
jgi:hypothetical protein